MGITLAKSLLLIKPFLEKNKILLNLNFFLEYISQGMIYIIIAYTNLLKLQNWSLQKEITTEKTCVVKFKIITKINF